MHKNLQAEARQPVPQYCAKHARMHHISQAEAGSAGQEDQQQGSLQNAKGVTSEQALMDCLARHFPTMTGLFRSAERPVVPPMTHAAFQQFKAALEQIHPCAAHHQPTAALSCACKAQLPYPPAAPTTPPQSLVKTGSKACPALTNEDRLADSKKQIPVPRADFYPSVKDKRRPDATRSSKPPPSPNGKPARAPKKKLTKLIHADSPGHSNGFYIPDKVPSTKQAKGYFQQKAGQKRTATPPNTAEASLQEKRGSHRTPERPALGVPDQSQWTMPETPLEASQRNDNNQKKLPSPQGEVRTKLSKPKKKLKAALSANDPCRPKSSEVKQTGEPRLQTAAQPSGRKPASQRQAYPAKRQKKKAHADLVEDASCINVFESQETGPSQAEKIAPREAPQGLREEADATSRKLQEQDRKTLQEPGVIKAPVNPSEADPLEAEPSPHGDERSKGWRESMPAATGLKMIGRRFVPQALLEALGLGHLSTKEPAQEPENLRDTPAEELPEKPQEKSQEKLSKRLLASRDAFAKPSNLHASKVSNSPELTQDWHKDIPGPERPDPGTESSGEGTGTDEEPDSNDQPSSSQGVSFKAAYAMFTSPADKNLLEITDLKAFAIPGSDLKRILVNAKISQQDLSLMRRYLCAETCLSLYLMKATGSFI